MTPSITPVPEVTAVLSAFSFISIFLNVLTMIAHFLLFKTIKQKRWLAFIPIIGDFIIFKTFWNWKFYLIYLIFNAIYMLFPQTIISVITSAVMMFILAICYDKIRKAFDKGWLWLLGMLIFYPIFVILLAQKGELNEEMKAKCEDDADNKSMFDMLNVDSSNPYYNPYFSKHDEFLWIVAGVFFPYISIFLYMLWRITKPQTANAILKGIIFDILIIGFIFMLLSMFFILAGMGFFQI